MSGVRCDLVIPVYNALRSTRDCLGSVKRHAPPWARIVVINDASDERTTEWLRGQDGITLLENPTNLGFVKTANKGLLFSDAPWVCLLNSDTLLTEGALERMIEGCERDPKIGLCCPLSNGAVNLSVKLPEGEDVFSFARRVARSGRARYPDAVTVVGFCLLVKREVIETLGVFDEVFGRGYCEETDLHYRARAAGWRSVVADDTFVYHRHGASFTDGAERTAKNMEILMGRWRDRHEREIEAFDRRDDLGPLRDAKTHEWVHADDRPAEPFDVLFVLPMMGVFGGVAAVLELTNALVLEGVRAGVVVLEKIEPEIDLELFFRPIRLSPAELAERCPRTKLLVATAYQTCPIVAATAARRSVSTSYFVQDYEAWFGGDDEAYVGATYALIPRMTSVSTWLADLIEQRHGVRPCPIPISADPETFYPRGGRSRTGPVRVVAMLRWDERRGLPWVIPALAKVAANASVEIVFFGSQLVPKDGPSFPHRHVGTLSREGVAQLLASAHIVVDPSVFQGFGLVGLEAMASGAACVLTESGGIREYAKDGENALIVPPKDAEALAAGVLRLVEDPALRERLARAGLVTARELTWQRTARAYVAFMESLPAPRPKSPSESAALELLLREVTRPRSGDPTQLKGELAALKETLQSVYRSTVWKAMTPYWRIKAKLKR